ncbi:MAG: pectate lyase [Marinilabiliaceae bacterium]|nr:pectate lyase [Marinilabiliaceae bacterium]
MMNRFIPFFAVLLLSLPLKSQNTPIAIEKFNDGIHHWYLEVRDTNYQRHSPENFQAIAKNLIAYQNNDGGWPKNIDWLAQLNPDSVKQALSERYRQSTFDNRNIYPQIEYLAHAYSRSGNKLFLKSAIKGLQYIFNNQHANGGWRGWDVDAITFNDDVMTGIMHLLLDIAQDAPQYSDLPNKIRKQSRKSLNRAVALTLHCQVNVNGVKKGWAQQHDHQTLAPTGARTFELPGLTANESSSIIAFLMRIEKPTPAIVHAIETGIAWLQQSAIYGIRIETVEVPEGTYPGLTLKIDRKQVDDPSAGPLWARFYETDTNRPFMCTRQGEKVFSLNEVNPERRAGYAWYGIWPQKLIEEQYPAWEKKWKQ